MSKNIMIKIKKAVRGYPVDATVRVRVDKDGIPVDVYWRRRLKDAESDNCIEVMKAEKPKKKPVKTEKKDIKEYETK